MLLLDEPLGALDLKLRQQMQVELKRIQREVGITFVYVTHDQEEALTMSDRLAVFNDGRIEQVGAPAEVYERPATEFVAGFVGVSNVLERDGAALHGPPREDADRSTTASRADGLHVERGTVGDVGYIGTVTRYVVELDAGGELQVVRQNLETSSAEALEQRGRQVTSAWRREHTYAIAETVNQRRRKHEYEEHVGGAASPASRRSASPAAAAATTAAAAAAPAAAGEPAEVRVQKRSARARASST